MSSQGLDLALLTRVRASEGLTPIQTGGIQKQAFVEPPAPGQGGHPMHSVMGQGMPQDPSMPYQGTPDNMGQQQVPPQSPEEIVQLIMNGLQTGESPEDMSMVLLQQGVPEDIVMQAMQQAMSGTQQQQAAPQQQQAAPPMDPAMPPEQMQQGMPQEQPQQLSLQEELDMAGQAALEQSQLPVEQRVTVLEAQVAKLTELLGGLSKAAGLRSDDLEHIYHQNCIESMNYE